MNAYQNKNGVKLFALVAVLAMVFAGTAVLMSDNGVDATSDKGTTYLNGEITGDSTQNYGVGTNVVVESGRTLTIPDNLRLTIAGGKFTVEEGASVVIKAGGQLIFTTGTGDVEPTITIAGTITAEGTDKTASENGAITYRGSIVNDAAAYNSTSKTGVILSGTITLERGAELLSSTDDDVGYITVNNGASINVTQRSTDISKIADQTVCLNVGATLDLNGKADNVTVQATGSGTNTIAGAVKIDAFSDTSNDKGWKVDDRSSSDLVFTVTSQNVSALTNPSDDKSAVTLRQYIVNVEGTLANGDVMTTVASASGTDYYMATGYAYTILPIVSVTGELTVENQSKVVVAEDTQVSVSGNVTFEYDSSTHSTTNIVYNATSEINGSMYVTGTATANTKTFSIGHTSSTANDNRIVVDGGSIALTTTDNLSTFLAANKDARLYGSVYLYDGGNNADDIIYIVDFDKAVTDAVAAESDEIYVFSYGSQNNNDAQDAADRGAYTISADISIPDNMTIYVWNALIVGEGATLTLEEGAEVIIYQQSASSQVMPTRDNDGRLFVEGKVVDYHGAMEEYEGVKGTFETDNGNQMFVYEVKKTTETDIETYVTYTSLKIALDGASNEEIQLNGTVTIDENLVISETVTVIADENVAGNGIVIEDATLTVNGVLDMKDKAFAFTDGDDTNKTADGNIIVNNYIVNVEYNNYQVWGTTATDKYLDGAYFNGIVGDAEEEANYIASVAVAAQASATVTDSIRIFGNIDMGDVTFTASEDLVNGLIVYIYNDEDDTATAGTITLNANVNLNTDSGDLSGNVAGADAVITLDGNKDTTISVVTIGVDEEATTQLQVSTMVGKSGLATSDGTMTIASGTVYIVKAVQVENMIIAEGAELVIGENGSLTTAKNPDYKINTLVKQLPLLTESVLESISGLTVNGTLTVGEKGTLAAEWAIINGTVAVDANATAANVNISVVNGTIDAADDKSLGFNVMILNGTIDGAVDIATYNGNSNWAAIIAYPESAVDNAEILYNGGNESKAVTSTYYVNGDEYATVYASNGNIPVDFISLFMDVSGCDEDTAAFYSDADMRQPLGDVSAINAAIAALKTQSYADFDLQSVIDALSDSYFVGDYSDVYVAMDASFIAGTITVYQGMEIYIDGLSLTNLRDTDVNSSTYGMYILDVGTHTFSVQVQPRFTGTTQVTVNGTAVSGDSFEITGDMKEFQIVSGNISQDTATGGSSDNSGLGLTDYLLIILVILIVVMAIMVAMRLMRS